MQWRENAYVTGMPSPGPRTCADVGGTGEIEAAVGKILTERDDLTAAISELRRH